MVCPSSPLDLFRNQTGGSGVRAHYTGIMGGTDIAATPAATGVTAYLPQFGVPTSSQIYRNRGWWIGNDTNSIITASGMLPIAEHTNIAKCSDGTSNTMIVGEQSDWLGHTDTAISTKFYGCASYATSGWRSGWPTGTQRQSSVRTSQGGACDQYTTNLTTVRYKPDLKRVLQGTTPAEGCDENHYEARGTNNPLQSPHPGGVLVAFVDGSVQFVAGTTDLAILLRIAIRDDGQNVSMD